jgi:hypothetical protein
VFAVGAENGGISNAWPPPPRLLASICCATTRTRRPTLLAGAAVSGGDVAVLSSAGVNGATVPRHIRFAHRLDGGVD